MTAVVEPEPLTQRQRTYPELIPYWPAGDELDPDDDPFEIAVAREKYARITAWECEPFDPEDDLSVIAEYPREVARLREVQADMKADPIYRVAALAGDRLRRRFLVEAGAEGPSFDRSASVEFYVAEVCQCELRGRREFDDGSPVYRRHRLADRCRWCTLGEEFARRRHAEIAAKAWGCSVDEARRRADQAERDLMNWGEYVDPDWWLL